eukprot:TRINITY_DN5925_c2_g1_i1.p1 TRINITY_DN5925_c2_g1~~TRINITY_DN5925_c2_g1_i1.p1  ORF type:complete len:523 (-),score=91.58 TRINITY_DN5925_c2_g1_i1:3-1403(-)
MAEVTKRGNNTAIICALPGTYEEPNMDYFYPGNRRRIQVLPAYLEHPLPVFIGSMYFRVLYLTSFELGYFNVTGSLVFDIINSNVYLHHLSSENQGSLSIQTNYQSSEPAVYSIQNISGLPLEVNVDALSSARVDIYLNESNLTGSKLYGETVRISSCALGSNIYISSSLVTIGNSTANHLSLYSDDLIHLHSIDVLKMDSNHFANNTLYSQNDPYLIYVEVGVYEVYFENNYLSCNTLNGHSTTLTPLFFGKGYIKKTNFENNIIDPTCPLVCSPGKAPGYGGVTCDMCPINFISKDGRECVPCPPGTDTSQSINCTQCPAGKFNPFPNGTCTQCQTSRVNNNSTICLPCPPGTEQSLQNPICNICPPGTFNPLPNGECNVCETGTPNSDSTGCVVCPPSSYSVVGICRPCNGTDYLYHTECHQVDDPTKYIIIGSVSGGTLLIILTIIAVGAYIKRRKEYTSLN